MKIKEMAKWKTSWSSTDTLINWTGAGCYQCLLEFEIFGIKIVIWRKK